MAGIKCLMVSLGVVAAVLASLPAMAQGYPNKPIRIIVPFAPGGGSDSVARIISERLAKEWGPPVIIENRAGAGGSIGAEFVAKSTADGYTLLVTDASAVTINPHVYPKLGYAARDLSPVVNLATFSLVLLVPVKSPIRTVADMVAADKAKPASLNGASPGAGSSPHLMLEMMNSLAGTKLVHVPYKGGGPAMTDLVGGQVDFSFSGLSTGAISMISGGKLKALAVTSQARSASLPDVPTFAESGFPGVDVFSAQSLLVPAGTPPEIINKLNQEISRILESPDVKTRWKEWGFLPRPPQSATLTSAWFMHESDRWSKLIKEKNIVAE